MRALSAAICTVQSAGRISACVWLMFLIGGSWMAVANADPRYPIPFDRSPDWSGSLVPSPSFRLPSISVLPQRVLGHIVVVVSLLSTKPLKSENDPKSLEVAAHVAYDALFKKNAKHLGNVDAYIVTIVYGIPDASGAMPEYAYIFTKYSNQWQPRVKLKEAELTSIETALGGQRF